MEKGLYTIKQLNVKTIMKRAMSIINYDVLWDRISNFARKAGQVSTRPVLILNINTVVSGTAYRHSGCQETAVHWLDRRNRLAFSHVSEGVQEHYARNGGKGGCHS